MHNYLSRVFLFRKLLRPLFTTIRTICDYLRLFALFVLFAIRYSGFPDTHEIAFLGIPNRDLKVFFQLKQSFHI